MTSGQCNAHGTTSVNSCFSILGMGMCEPCARADTQCNAAFPACEGACMALSTDQTGSECNDVARPAAKSLPQMTLLKDETEKARSESVAKEKQYEAEKQKAAANLILKKQQIQLIRMHNNEKAVLKRQEKERAQQMEEEQKRLLFERQEFEQQQLARERARLLERQEQERKQMQLLSEPKR